MLALALDYSCLPACLPACLQVGWWVGDLGCDWVSQAGLLCALTLKKKKRNPERVPEGGLGPVRVEGLGTVGGRSWIAL